MYGEESTKTLKWPSKPYAPIPILRRRKRYGLNAYEWTLFKLIVQILWKFVPMWKKFDHPSIVTFRGVNMEIFPLALVYDWAGNNNIIRYLESHPGAPRRALV